MRLLYTTTIVFILLTSCQTTGKTRQEPKIRGDISSVELQDKIKGGWAGQVIGCTYGGPTEFSHPGTMIQDYQTIPWDSTRISWYFEHSPGLYDDVYMDLTFMAVMEKEGIEASAASHALAFARAPYPLWHANQAARYNILQGIMPPESGHWKNNPHAEDIDFQIEADFAGLMTPGMPQTAVEICDRIGHIMNYGDGWYGGVYMAVMYSLAFISDDIEWVVEEGLKSIPAESRFYRCIADVIQAYRTNPEDWKLAWFTVEKNWASDIGCPDGVFRPFNIDANVNAAYVVIGLLYGRGDFGKTIDISTRCGQDSDCNPASAGGILGTMIGYSGIPVKWIAAINQVEDLPFSYTELSLNKVYTTGYKHAIEMITKHGGEVSGENIRIASQPVKTVQTETNFAGLKPIQRKRLGILLDSSCEITFEGAGFVLTGGSEKTVYGGTDPEIYRVEITIDDSTPEIIYLPVSYLTRRQEIAWKYDLAPGNHIIRLKIPDQNRGAAIRINDLITYQKI